MTDDSVMFGSEPELRVRGSWHQVESWRSEDGHDTCLAFCRGRPFAKVLPALARIELAPVGMTATSLPSATSSLERNATLADRTCVPTPVNALSDELSLTRRSFRARWWAVDPGFVVQSKQLSRGVVFSATVHVAFIAGSGAGCVLSIRQ